MSFEEEWARLKAENDPPDGGSPAMRLASADDGSAPGQSGKDADVVVRDDELGALGSQAYRLHGRLRQVGDHAKESSSQAAKSLSADGVQAGDALGEVVRTWGTQVRTLLEACALISNHLDYTTQAHQKEEEKITTELRNSRKQPMTASSINQYFE